MTATEIREIDTDAARELDLYAENTGALYNQFLSIIRNVALKIRRGRYDPKLAPKLWQYWYDEAARHYVREYGGTVAGVFPVSVRRYISEQRAADEYDNIMNGEYDLIVGIPEPPR